MLTVRSFIGFGLVLDLAGIASNGVSLLYIKNKFDLGKTIFKLLLFDAILSLSTCSVFAIIKLMLLFIQTATDASCWLEYISTSVFTVLLNALLSLLIACIRYSK